MWGFFVNLERRSDLLKVSISGVGTVVVLGANGMLGSRVVKKLMMCGHDVFPTVRWDTDGNSHGRFDVLRDNIQSCASHWPQDASYVVNCIGVIKPRINESDSASVEQAIRVNSLFPHQLAAVAEEKKMKVLQIATDCVYSGSDGLYNETAAHDPVDVYGKSKSLGEVTSRHVMHLRCSIIGPELGRSTSLWEWVAGQPACAEISGYQNHHWNGITTDAFGELCDSIIRSDDLFAAGVTHVVPADIVSKEQLALMILERVGRTDVKVKAVDAPMSIDRTLSTTNNQKNSDIWRGTSFCGIPTIQRMVRAVELIAR